MDRVLSIYKPVSLTPLQLIDKLREVNPEYRDIKIGYAGRLDPLAHGVMLLTIGDENKNRQKYLNLNKSYNFSVLFGVETDSYDYLGILKNLHVKDTSVNLKILINKFIRNNIGKLTQTYPQFSSKTIDGVPLYKLAKSGKLKEEDLPKREIEVFKFKLISLKNISSEKIEKEILNNLKKITGHFRKQKTISLWKELFNNNPGKEYVVAHFSIDCSSGTYVRSLANSMGQEFNCGAIAYEIYRTKVGTFNIEDCLKI